MSPVELLGWRDIINDMEGEDRDFMIDYLNALSKRRR